MASNKTVKRVKLTRFIDADSIPAPVKVYAFQRGIGRNNDPATEVALTSKYGENVMAAAAKLITEPARKNFIKYKADIAAATAVFERTMAGIAAARLGSDEAIMQEFGIKL